MYIKKIKGSFGTLKNEELIFNPGLNVVQRDNEWGKSTMISLIKTMFYGLNTSKRDKKDYLSEKTKYVSSGEFQGEMVLDLNGREANIFRTKKLRGGDFKAYFSDNFEELPVASTTFGKEILGISEEAFANSALIEADNRLISKSDELYDLILAMSTTGDTDLNYQSAIKSLKNMKTSLVKNSSVKDLENKLEEFENNLIDIDMHEKEIINLARNEKLNLSNLKEKQDEYEEKYRKSSMYKLEIDTRNSVIKEQSTKILEDLKKDFYEISEIEKTQEALESYLKTESDEYEARILLNQKSLSLDGEIAKLQELRSAEIKQNAKIKPHIIPLIISGILAILSFSTTFFDAGNLTYILPALTLLVLVFAFLPSKSENPLVNKKFDEMIRALNDELSKLEATHKGFAQIIKQKYDDMILSAQNIGGKNIENADDVRRQINFAIDINERYYKALEFDQNTSENLDVYDDDLVLNLEKELQTLQNELIFLEKKYEISKRELTRCELFLENITPKNQLNDSLLRVQEQLLALKSKLLSIEIAMDTITEANDSLTSRLSPEISKHASKYLSRITDGKFDEIILKKDFDALCKTQNDYTHLDKLRLSSGTKDQLYFSLRLAICDVLLNENTPIILDDPFIFYDDARATTAMKLLLEISKKRQVILFTCHNRDKNIFSSL